MMIEGKVEVGDVNGVVLLTVELLLVKLEVWLVELVTLEKTLVDVDGTLIGVVGVEDGVILLLELLELIGVVDETVEVEFVNVKEVLFVTEFEILTFDVDGTIIEVLGVVDTVMLLFRLFVLDRVTVVRMEVELVNIKEVGFVNVVEKLTIKVVEVIEAVLFGPCDGGVVCTKLLDGLVPCVKLVDFVELRLLEGVNE